MTNTSRAKSGSTVVVFDVAGATYTANVPWTMEATPDGGLRGHRDNGTLDEGNGNTLGTMQRWPTPTPLTAL